ncbi:similar to An12g03510 [Aspergillus niger]|uniref:Similar to An12g03510 n=1 Tax=Aspergillus niger TaxID=5061 RepID=A0A100IPQ7_ASPNG|nr:similar to An12g03510 [Aspergillus niger]
MDTWLSTLQAVYLDVLHPKAEGLRFPEDELQSIRYRLINGGMRAIALEVRLESGRLDEDDLTLDAIAFVGSVRIVAFQQLTWSADCVLITTILFDHMVPTESGDPSAEDPYGDPVLNRMNPLPPSTHPYGFDLRNRCSNKDRYDELLRKCLAHFETCSGCYQYDKVSWEARVPLLGKAYETKYTDCSCLDIISTYMVLAFLIGALLVFDILTPKARYPLITQLPVISNPLQQQAPPRPLSCCRLPKWDDVTAVYVFAFLFCSVWCFVSSL